MENQNKNFLSYFYNVLEQAKYGPKKTKKPQLAFSFVFSFILIIGLSFGMRTLEERVFHVENEPLPTKLNPFHLSVAQAADYNNEAAFLVQSHKHVRIVPNKGFTFIVKFKNTGNKTWNKGHVYLKSLTTGLKFRHEFWPDAFLPGAMQEDYVPPGGEATFKFAVQAPPAFGDFEGDFVLADDNVMIKNGKIEISMDVCEDPNQPSENPASEPEKETPAPAPVPVTPNPTTTTPTPGYCPYKISSAYANDPNCIPETNSTGPLMRVGIFYSEDTFQIKNSKSWTLTDSGNNSLLNIKANQIITLDYNESNSTYSYILSGNTENSAKYLKLKNSGNGIWTITNYENRPAWNTSLNDNTFKGDLEIRYNSSKDRAWLINEIKMEDYLRGIAETSDGSPTEYLKTMAIAARTYAYYHFTKATKHADEYFHVDSKYDQVYKGHNVSLRLIDMQKAIDQTNGIIATYEGRPIVAAYFSRSDGRTRSFKEVWGYDVPYLVSVPCPYSDGEELWGHGVGIDAKDAYHRAYEGKATYDEILKYYYTGITLDKVW